MWAVAACVSVTLLSWPLRNLLDPANIAMLYLLAVAIVATRAGRYAAIVTAFLSTVLLDFFFVHPVFSFTVGDVQYVITLAVMLAALIIGNLTIGLQRQTMAAIERERQAHALYQLASQLAGASTLEQVVSATHHFLLQAQGRESVLLMRRNDALHPVACYSAGQVNSLANFLASGERLLCFSHVGEIATAKAYEITTSAQIPATFRIGGIGF